MYKINYKNVIINFLIEILNLIMISLFIVLSWSAESGDNVTKVVKLVIIFALFFFSIYLLYRIIILVKKVKDIRCLSNCGKLIESIPFEIKHRNSTRFLGKYFECAYLIIDYTTEYGENIKLKSNLFFLNPYDKYDTIDLLYDLSNPKRFYIDSNIERK